MTTFATNLLIEWLLKDENDEREKKFIETNGASLPAGNALCGYIV